MLWRQTRHELTALRRTPITLILSIGLPLLFFVLLSALIGNEVVDERGGVRVVQYLAPGMAAFGVVMATFSFLAIGLAEARSTGVVKRQSGAPVPRWVLIGGRMGAALLLGLTSTALVLAAGVAFYDLQIPSRSVLAIIVTLVLASACFSALGLALAMALPTMQLTIAVSNGIVIPLAFISDMFMMTGQMPDWLATIGWLFPLKHLTAVFADALNPYLSGSGFELDHLAVIALWGLAGAVVATVQLRRDRDRDAARPSDARPSRARARRRVADSTPRRTSAPPWAALLTEQVRHAQSVLWRNASAVFFAVAFPVLLVAIIPAVNGGGDLLMDGGQTLGVFYAGTMAIYGAAVTAYVNMPQGVAEARDRGVLKRTGGTPLPAAALVVGRVVGALVVALLTGVAIIVLAALVFRPTVPPGLPAAAVVLAVVGDLLRRRGPGRDDLRALGAGADRGDPGHPAPARLRLRHLRHRCELPTGARGGVVVLPAAARLGRDERGPGAGAHRHRPRPGAPRRCSCSGPWPEPWCWPAGSAGSRRRHDGPRQAVGRSALMVGSRVEVRHGEHGQAQGQAGKGGGKGSSTEGRYLSPGVYVEEIDSGARPIEGVGTSIAAFVGFGENSPDDGVWLRRGAATVLVVGATVLGIWAWRRGAARRGDRRPSLIRLPVPLDNIQPYGCMLST